MADQERRYAPDGGYYTYQEFFDFYGREDEWHDAGPDAAGGKVGEAPTPGAAQDASSSEEESSSGSDIDSEEEERVREAEMMQARMARLRVGPWELEVSVLRATGLHEVGNGLSTRSQTNPFVTLHLNKERIAKTKTLRRTTKPEWEYTTGIIRATGPAWLRKLGGYAVSKEDLDAESERTGRLLLLEKRVKEEKDRALRSGKMWDQATSQVLMDAAAAEREALLSETKGAALRDADAGSKSERTSTAENGQSAGAGVKKSSQEHRDHHHHKPGGKWKDAELKLQVFDWDRLAAHRFLGQVVIPGTRLASLIKGVKRMRRRKPKRVKPEGDEGGGNEGIGGEEKKKDSGSNSNSDGSSSSESSESSSESESDSDSDDSGSSTESDGSGQSGRSSMSSEPEKPKYLSYIDHYFEEEFKLQEREEDKADTVAEQVHEAADAADLSAAVTETQRELRLRRLRAIQKAESTVDVEGTLTIRVTLRAISVFDTELISKGQLFMEKKKKMKILKKIRKKLRRGKPVEYLITKAAAEEAINKGIDPGDVNRKWAAPRPGRKEEEDPDLKLTPLEELYVAIDRFHVGSITRAELLRSLTQDRVVQKLLTSHHFEQMGFQLLGRPRLFAEAFTIMDYKRTGEIDFRSFSLFAAHMQATDAPNRLLLRMVYDVILADVVKTVTLKVTCGEASRALSAGESWLLKRDMRDGLTRNRRAVRLLQRAKTMQVLAYDRIFGESLMRLQTQRAGYISYEEFVSWARGIERERAERIALAKIFDAILHVDQLETAGSAEAVKRSVEQEDLVEPDTVVDKWRLIHSMERMTLPRYSEVYKLVSGKYKHLFRPLLRPGLYVDALRALPTSRGGEIHFEEFASFVIKYCRHDYRSRMVLWNVFDELLPADLDSATGSLNKSSGRGETFRDMINRLFRYIDVNNDGQLSKTELLTAVTRRRKREPELDMALSKLSEIFPKLKLLGKPGSITNALLEMDTDRDGEVSVNELLTFCQSEIKTTLTIPKKSMIRSLHGGRARITEYLAVQGSPRKKRHKRKRRKEKKKRRKASGGRRRGTKNSSRNGSDDDLDGVDEESGLYRREDALTNPRGYSILLTPRLWQESLLRRPTTKKGQLTFEEFVLFCNDMRASAEYRSLLRRVFDAVDIEGNGRIGNIGLVEGLGQSEVKQIVQKELDREMKEIRDRQKREAEAKLGRKKKKHQKRKAAQMSMDSSSVIATASFADEGKTASPGTTLSSADADLNEVSQEQGRSGYMGGEEEGKTAGRDEEEGVVHVPAHHPLNVLLRREFYHTPLMKASSHMVGKKGIVPANEDSTTAGLDYEDFVCAVIPLFGSIKERLAVMRAFEKLNVVTALGGEHSERKNSSEFLAYDESHTVSVKDPRLLPELQRELLALDRDLIGRTLLYPSAAASEKVMKPPQMHQTYEPRPLLHKDLCTTVLLNLRVKHVNSRKGQRYATLEELVQFLLRMRKEHRGRDAARDIYEAMRFARGMPLENFEAPTPPVSVMAALLDDAGREYINDEVHRRPHRRPSRPVDALMVLMNKTREALVVPTAERQWSISTDGDHDDRGSLKLKNQAAISPERERLDLVSLATNYHIRDKVESDELSREFFEQSRFATAEVVGRMDDLVVLQRPKLFLEFLKLRNPSNYEQFYQFVTDAQSTMKTRAVLRRIFDLIDTDMSNDLSKQELLFAFTRSREVRLTLHQLEGLKTMQDPHLFEAAFEAIDVDNDGSASYEELVQFALKSGNDGNMVIMDNEDEDEWEVPEEEEVLKINGETVDDKWDELRRKEGALPDHDPMYRPMDYSNDDDNETTGVIYEELHELYEIFDKMWDGVSGEQPKDPYEHIIQILRREQASRRLRLGIDLTLTDVNEHLPKEIRQDLYMCCKSDDPERLSKVLEVHELSLDHRCFYVNRTEHGDHRGDGVPGFGWQLEPAYHRAYDSTLLHAASWFGSDKVMTWLLERGADADVREILHRNAKDVAGSDPIKLLLHTRTLGRVWQNTDDPYEMDKRFASYSNWRKKKKRSGAPVWKPADSRQKTALEKRLMGAYRVEKIKDNSQAEADAKSFLRRKGDGGSKVTDVVEAKTNLIGDPGHHIDKNLMANKYLKK